LLKITAIYDNGGKTVDRYTVVLHRVQPHPYVGVPPHVYACLSLSDDPDSPQGFSQFGPCVLGDHLGREIRFEDLPENVQEHIRKRLE
jgi:hypothetical protein